MKAAGSCAERKMRSTSGTPQNLNGHAAIPKFCKQQAKLESALAAHLQRLYKDQGVLVVEDDSSHRLSYHCTLCGKWAYTDSSLADHLQGKRHAKAMESAPPSTTAPPPPSRSHCAPVVPGSSKLTSSSNSRVALAYSVSRRKPCCGRPKGLIHEKRKKQQPCRLVFPEGKRGAGGASRVLLPPWKLVDVDATTGTPGACSWKAAPFHVHANAPHEKRRRVGEKVKNAEAIVCAKVPLGKGSLDVVSGWKEFGEEEVDVPAAAAVLFKREVVACSGYQENSGSKLEALHSVSHGTVALWKGSAAVGKGSGALASRSGGGVGEELGLMVLDYGEDIGRSNCCPDACDGAVSCALVQDVGAPAAAVQGPDTAGVEGSSGGESDPEIPPVAAAVESKGRQGHQEAGVEDGAAVGLVAGTVVAASEALRARNERRRGRRKGRWGERHCFICGQPLQPGCKVATPWNVETGQPACSSRNDHGMFHIFHVDCLTSWLNFSTACVHLHKQQKCDLLGNQTSETLSPAGEHSRRWSALGEDEEEGRCCPLSFGLGSAAQPSLAPLQSGGKHGVGTSPSEVGGVPLEPGSLSGSLSHGLGTSTERLLLEKNKSLCCALPEHCAELQAVGPSLGPAGMLEVFCPECQGTGRRGPGGALEHPRYKLAQVYDWLLTMLLANKTLTSEGPQQLGAEKVAAATEIEQEEKQHLSSLKV